MTVRERLSTALADKEPDRVPITLRTNPSRLFV